MNLISNLYDIHMECVPYANSTSNVQINDYVTIIVKVLDFNGQPVPLKDEFQISWNKGDNTVEYLLEENDEWISISKGAYVQTNSEGYFKIKYHATAWGLCTILCGHKKLQFYVRGFKEIDVTSTNECTFEVDESIRCCRLKWAYTYTGTTSSNYSSTVLDTISLPTSKYQGEGYMLLAKKTYNSRFNIVIDGQRISIVNMDGYSGGMSSHYEYFEWYY